MPNERIKLYLKQILDAITKIEISTVGLTRQTYEDHEIKWVVERGIEIIGEALNRIKTSDPALMITNSQKIIATRNKIAHEYDIVDPEILFSIVTIHLPVLKDEIQKLVEKE
ncbi:MAG: DUF86 domain-containing protein [Flavisolibacter sp.]|nr:DUF86 domain-containing protein [Flavisolibacter sp.]